MSSEHNKIMGYFIEETKEHLNTIDQSLLHLTMTVADADKISEAFRAAHSIKGGAAMLGIKSIQQIAHVLEDGFKLLKEVPVDIDQTLESLLLATVDSLKRLFAHLNSPTGLMDQAAAEITSEVEPTITELIAHLKSLRDTPLVASQPHGSQPQPATRAAPVTAMLREVSPNQPTLEEDSALQLIFKSDVPKLLQYMWETFKQPDGASSRQHLGEICRNLLQAGETFELREWSELIQIVTLTCQNTQKTYHALAPVIIKEIKQARQLVLTGKATEIQPSPELKLLLPYRAADDTSIDKNYPRLTQETLITMNPNSPDTPNNLLIFQLESIQNLSSESTSAAPQKSSKSIETQSSNAGKSNYKQLSQEKTKGPEVGAAELNTLKDLFDGEEIAGWHEDFFDESEDFLAPDKVANSPDSIETNEEDFSDLLFDEDESDPSHNKSMNHHSDSDIATMEEPDFFDEMAFLNQRESSPGLKSKIIPDEDDSFEDLFDLEDLSESSEPASSTSQVEDLNSLFNEASDEDLDLNWENEIENLGSTSATEELDMVWDLDDSDSARKNNLDLEDKSALPPSWLKTSDAPRAIASSHRTYIQETPEPSADDLDLSIIAELSELDSPQMAIDASPFVAIDESGNLDDELSYDDLFSIADIDESEMLHEGDSMSRPLLRNRPHPSISESSTESLEELFGELLESEAKPEPNESNENVGISADFADIFGEKEPDLPSLDAADDSSEADADVPWLNFDAFATEAKNEKAVDFSDLDNLFNDEALVSANQPLSFEEIYEETEELSSLDDFSLNDLTISNESDAELDMTAQNSADLNDLLALTLSDTSLTDTSNDLADLLSDDLLSDESFDVFAELDEGGLLSETIPKPEASYQPQAVSEEVRTQVEFSDLEKLLDQNLAENLDGSVSSTVNFTGLEELLDQPLPKSLTSLQVDFNDLEAFLSKKVSQNYAPVWLTELEEFLNDQKPNSVETNPPIEPTKVKRDVPPKTPRPGATETMRVPVKQLDNLGNLIGELVVNRNTLEQDQERMRQFLDNLLHQVQNLTDVGQRMQDLYERVLLEIALLSSRKNHFMPEGSFQLPHSTGHDLSVFEMDKFTPFHILAQEILELIVRVRESASDIEFLVDETDQVTRQLRQITNKLQEGINRSRMVPFAQITDRLPLGVRNNSIKFGKQVDLVVEGADTLIDKMILENLTDPMTHLVNNALAHGVEVPEERQRKGKPPKGRITVRAFHQGNQTVISVSDDGAGIDAERVKAKALDKGLITPAEAKTLSRLEVYDLLFAAGFSTKEVADDLSGRGVGLDVVRTNLSSIRGVVNIDSNLGKGTTFSIRVPLAFSISKALICISDRARIAFPMDGVEDMLDVPSDKIQTVFKDDKEETFIPWRDTILPFRPMSKLLVYHRHLGRGSVFGGNAEEDIISVVVLRSAGNYLALQVDQVLGEQEIVIKQLEGPVPKPIGIAGATVMGDGRIVAIADVLELIDLAAGRISDKTSDTWIERVIPVPPEGEKPPTTVLIVDDSITVRELLSMTFNKAGYRVEQSRDGQEAWEKLKSGLPCDIVFCDIEMPRMDGLELLSRLQKDPQLSVLPMAMLTSRGAKKHMQMAIDMGAKGYFTKPYLEEALLEAASRMLKGEVLVPSKSEV
jgi:chemosensory pili system protein ChpA (sensor histidine kinase/response regulator)